MRLFKLASAALSLLLISSCAALAEDALPLRGYDAEARSYQYVTFGRYPYEEDGTEKPVLWRVLGKGVPGEDDVLTQKDAAAFNKAKYANGDDVTPETEDVYCLMTAHIIDTVLYNDVRDELDGPALDYKDAMIYQTLNTETINRLFTSEEQSVLVDMPGRGRLSPPSRKGELFRVDYGFETEDFTKARNRPGMGTPYAFARGLRHVNGKYSWYWTTDWRRYGQRWIVGDDGHISVSGLDREGGVRLVVYVHADQMKILGGDGTGENPYQLTAK